MKRCDVRQLPFGPKENTIQSSEVRPDLPGMVFDKLIELMPAPEFCSRYGYSMTTIYDWKYRPHRNKIPKDLVVKFRGKLFIRTDILRSLIPFKRA